MKNLRIIIFALVVLPLTFGYSKVQSGDFIDWQANRQLKWSDFKEKTPRNTPHAALTNSGISLDLSFRNGTYEIGVIAQFDKLKSWHKKDANSENLLAHEQLHFDITELYARKLRKRIVTGRWKSSEEFDDALNTIYSDNRKALSAFQDQYDEATEHSLIVDAQKEWEAMIADSLDAYVSFRGQNLSLEL